MGVSCGVSDVNTFLSLIERADDKAVLRDRLSDSSRSSMYGLCSTGNSCSIITLMNDDAMLLFD
jgi:hypothetical protein